MYYNMDEINKFIRSFSYGLNDYFTEDDVENYINNIGLNYPDIVDFTYATGATKCVIIPKDRDYVIKIPFNASSSENYGSCFYSDYEDDFIDSNEYIDFRYGGGEYDNDYCALEQEIYEEVKENNSLFLSFFLPNTRVTKPDEYPIYVQPRAFLGTEYSSPPSEKSMNTIKSVKRQTINASPYWLAKCLEDFNNNVDYFLAFMRYLIDNKINRDLHSSNLGYWNNHAVIIDYAGYWEEA